MKDFKIPLQSEVSKYMNEKKGWPIEFCRYYADRFWNFYNSNGWKVSGRAAMKNWQSAFNANWQNIKFDEDIKKLAECSRNKQSEVVGLPKGNVYQRLDVLMMQSAKDANSISIEKYCEIYKWLKERSMIAIEADQEQIVSDLCTDECRANAMRVKFLFNNMYAKGQSFIQKSKHAL